MSPPPRSERDCKKNGPANLSLSSKLGLPGEGDEPNENKGSDQNFMPDEVEHADADEDGKGNQGDDQNDQDEDQGEQADDERDRCEIKDHRTTALRMQFELETLQQFPSLAQEYLTDETDGVMPQSPKEEDDTSSVSSGMEWFLPSPCESEFEEDDDDVMSFYSSCESENENSEAAVRPSCEYDAENQQAEGAAPAAKVDDKGKGKITAGQVKETCHFMKLPPEIRCIIYRYCLPQQKKNRSLICMWPAKPRNQICPTPVSRHEPADYQLPSFSSNLHSYPLNGPREAPIQRERDYVGQTILAVNRLIYEEASQEFYNSHTFRFNSRQIETRNIYSGLIPRLRSIEIEDAVFRFCLRSTEMKLIGLSRNANLERLVIGPRTAEGLFSVIRDQNRTISGGVWKGKSEEMQPYAANMYSADFFKTKSFPGLPKVAIVELNYSAVFFPMRTDKSNGAFPHIPAPLEWSDVSMLNHISNMGWFLDPDYTGEEEDRVLA